VTLAPGTRACRRDSRSPGFRGTGARPVGPGARAAKPASNAPGTIDSDFPRRGEVILGSFGSEPFEIRRGDRIAQLVVSPVARATFESAPELPETGRGAGGFGSTGV
jgi:dUTP pyrophosphatase